MENDVAAKINDPPVAPHVAAKIIVPTAAPPIAAPRNSLFRQEAVDFQLYDRQWGGALVLQPVSRKLERWSLLGAVTAILAFLCFAQYARKETVIGYLKPSLGTVKIFPTQAGVVREISVREGQGVSKGQELVTIETPQIGAGGQDVNVEMLTTLALQKAQLSRQVDAEGRREKSEQARMTATIQSLNAQIDHLQAEILIQAKRIKLSQNINQAAAQLNAKRFMTDVEYERRQQETLQLELQLNSMNDQLLTRQNQRSETQFVLDQLPIVTADRIRVLRNEMADVEQRISEIEGRRAYKLRSPIDGHVSMLQLTLGQSVDSRQLQIAVIPTGSVLQAEVFVPSRAVGFIRLGQPVRISYDAFPYQRHGTHKGTITKLSDTVLSPSDISGPVSVRESVYRAVVTLDRTNIEANGHKIEVRPDMLLQADIVLEKRSILSWILNPLYGTQKAIDLTPLWATLRDLATHPALVSSLDTIRNALQEVWIRATELTGGFWDSFKNASNERTPPDPASQRNAGQSET